MRNLALVWVLAACLLGCGGRDNTPQTPAVGVLAETTLDTMTKDYTHTMAKDYPLVCHPPSPRATILTGSRSQASILRVIYVNGMSSLRYAYNRRLREKPEFAKGITITVKFTIDEFGKVISAQVDESTANDTTLENTIVNKISGWIFEKIDKPGDTTVVTFPYRFSQ